MPFTKYANLDFDQIKTSIKDYLRANSDFTDFDFEGSNFSVLIDTLAYNTYITAFNSNLAVNESFIESATLRENVVSLARNIGYVPRSVTASQAKISFAVKFFGDTTTVTLKAGLICVGKTSNTSFIFSIPEDITTESPLDNQSQGSVTGDRTAVFSNIDVFQGSFAKNTFNVDQSLDQRFIIPNSFVDTSTIIVRVKGPSDTSKGDQFNLVDNIVDVKSDSKIFFIQEVKDERYELLFGDGILGQKLETGSQIDVTYIVTNGPESNGINSFNFSGQIRDSLDGIITPTQTINITTEQKSQNGANIESIESVKYFAPRIYSSQYRAVTASDYETLVKSIYPLAESVSVTGGEDLNPPRFGEVIISIKPKDEFFISDFNKLNIVNQLKRYSLAGIKASIIDLEILYIELESFVYYNTSKVTSTDDLRSDILKSLSTFAKSDNLNNFGGRFKYSKLLNKIDSSNSAITSNITRVKIRRNLSAKLNQPTQYELCYGNKFFTGPQGRTIKSTGFKIAGVPDTVFISDVPNVFNQNIAINEARVAGEEVFAKRPATNIKITDGVLQFISIDSSNNIKIINRNAGKVDYVTGEIILFTTNIVSTQLPGGIVEIQAFPESNDVIGLKNVFVELSIDRSQINILKDTISSGEQISGVGFPVTSSYSNGTLIRQIKPQ